MPDLTQNLGLQKPLENEVADIAVINQNMDVIDKKFGVGGGEGHTHNGQVGQGEQISYNDLKGKPTFAAVATSGSYNDLSDKPAITPAGIGAIPNSAGSVTDSNIGNRTVDQTQAPTGATGNITQLFSWLANRIKAITGKTNWWDAPSKTLEDLNSHINDTATAHGATSAATASKIMIRDANGRAKVAAPSVSDDIARKDTVDAVQTNLNAHTALTTTAHGGIVASSDIVTSPIANKILKLDGNGKFPVSAITQGTGSGLDADMVDGKHLSDLYLASTAIYSGDLNNLLTWGVYNCQDTCMNKPENSWGAVYVSHIAHSLWMQQLWLGQNGTMWLRRSYDSGSTRVWDVWKQVTFGITAGVGCVPGDNVAITYTGSWDAPRSSTNATYNVFCAPMTGRFRIKFETTSNSNTSIDLTFWTISYTSPAGSSPTITTIAVDTGLHITQTGNGGWIARFVDLPYEIAAGSMLIIRGYSSSSSGSSATYRNVQFCYA